MKGEPFVVDAGADANQFVFSTTEIERDHHDNLAVWTESALRQAATPDATATSDFATP